MAALAVVYGNGQILTGAPASALWGAPMSRIGLDLLFSISGFLAADAWLRRPSLRVFAWHRLARMMPALVVCVGATVAVIGPLATQLTLRQYAFNPLTKLYLGNAVFLQQLWLPVTFVGQQWAGTVNPMLWTLLPGLLLCLGIGAIGRAMSVRAAAPALAALAVLSALASQLIPLAPFPVPQAPRLVDIATEAPFLLLAAALRFAQAGLGAGGPRFWRADLAMLAFALNWIGATWLGGWNIVIEWIGLPYLLVCFGAASLPLLGRAGRLGNPSYGIYLYAFPVQQLIVARWPGCPAPMLACAAVVLVLGTLSWFLVERPVLDWVRRRGERVPAPRLRTVSP